ncbi:MAG: M1 family aminopeptidase [Polyangiaceae bacterium]
MSRRALAVVFALAAGCGSRPEPAAPAPSNAVAASSASAASALPPKPWLNAPASVAVDELPVYEIDQAIDDASGSFAGRLRLTFQNPSSAPLDEVPLLFHANAAAELGAPGSGTIDLESATLPTGEALRIERVRPTYIKVTLSRPLPPGESLGLELRYRGRLRALGPGANDAFKQALQSMSSLSGSGASDYGLLASGDGLLTLATAYPMLAPYGPSGFDTHPPDRVGDLAYNTVARFSVRTVVPAGLGVVTNLADGAPEPLADERAVILSEGSFVRDFVLVAGRDLERRTKDSGGVRVTSVYRARDAAAGAVALDMAVSALDSFQRRFGAYPYSELDVVEASIVGGAGGVEFNGLTLVAGMLYRSASDSESPMASLMKLWGSLGGRLGDLGEEGEAGRAPRASSADDTLHDVLEFTVAHEVAHQYFAELVGNDSHTDPAFDEPAAQYLAGLAILDRHGATAAARAMDSNVKLNYALYRLLGGQDRPALRATSSFRTPLEYAALVYGKAPYVYVALAKRLGADRLHAAMRAVIDHHRFGLVSTRQWIEELATELGPEASVRETFARYFDEAHGDADLGVDDSGDFVLEAMFPPEVSSALREATATLGIGPRDLLRMLFGGALGDDAPIGRGLDPERALDDLGERRAPKAKP